MAGLGAAALDGPLAFPRGETVLVASSFEQARISFEHILAFMGDKLDNRDRWRVWDTAQQARIEDRKRGVRVRCIGSDPRWAHGLAPVLILQTSRLSGQTTRATAWLQLLAPPPGSNHTVFSWHWGRNQHPNIIGFPSGYAAVLTMRSSTRRATVIRSFSGAHGARQTQALTTCQTVPEEALDTDHELTGFVRTRTIMSRCSVVVSFSE